MKINALAGLLLVIFVLLAMGAQQVQAATNSLTTYSVSGSVVGGATNKVSWSLAFAPTTVYITPWLNNVFVGQTKAERIIKLGSVATTNGPFAVVVQSNTVSYLLEGHDELYIMSTNAVAVTNTYNITLTR